MGPSSAEGPRRPRQAGIALLVKVGLDRLVATVALLLALPVLVAAAVAVRWSMGAPVLFAQERPGRHARPFRLLKFRTMREATGPDGRALPDHLRLTRAGRWLRATSVDELPQLWNVLRGDLSLVGPRPLLMRYLPRYTPEQARRHEVLPGITGWAQVNGRNAISWEEKFALDVWYVDHWSLALDLRILAATAVKVLRREGVSGEGHATMTEFTGSAGPETPSPQENARGT
jgi:lipopolysaccharide/colanic/teichoic acid biosynthesis glycosyltransferase